MTQPQYLYLTTTGRKTGLPREIEIWFTAQEGRYYLIAEKGEQANWVRNIRQDPRVSFRVGEKSFIGRGRVIREDEAAELLHEVRGLSDSKYGWSDGLIVELIPAEQLQLPG